MARKLNRTAALLRTLLVAAAAVLTASCSRPTPPEKTYPVGTTVDLGHLSYSVSGATWSGSLEGERGPRVPSHQFLVLTVSVSNKNSEPVTMPLLTVVDASGKPHLELDNGEGLANWLGLFRTIAPNGSDGGQVIFDVAAKDGPYKLRVSSGGDVEKETTALIEVPDEKATPPAGPLAPTAGQ